MEKNFNEEILALIDTLSPQQQSDALWLITHLTEVKAILECPPISLEHLSPYIAAAAAGNDSRTLTILLAKSSYDTILPPLSEEKE